MSEISYKVLTIYVPVIRNKIIEYKAVASFFDVGTDAIFNKIGSISSWSSLLNDTTEVILDDIQNLEKAGYNTTDTLIESTTNYIAEALYEDDANRYHYNYDDLVDAIIASSTSNICTVYLGKLKLQTYLDSLVQINDQKLIDIVYVDDESNKHKYSGPFINDLTITSEIQEKLTALDTLSTQIGELKTKLETLGTTVTSTGSKIKFTTDLTQYEDDSSVVTVMTPSDSPIIDIWENATSIGWIDFGRLLKSNSTSFYLSLPSDTDPSYCSLHIVGDWSNIQNYVPTGLDDIATIVIGNTTIFTNGSVINDATPPLGLESVYNTITVTDSDGDNHIIHFYLGFKPEE